MIIAGTGHRPEDCEAEDVVRERIRRNLGTLVPWEHNVVISGMASGYDLWLGDEALSMGFEVWAARPWASHMPRSSDDELYSRVFEGASRKVNVDASVEFPGNWVYHKRNEWMVDNATHVLAYYNGKGKGGTFACLQYAMKQQVPIRNIYGSELT